MHPVHRRDGGGEPGVGGAGGPRVGVGVGAVRRWCWPLTTGGRRWPSETRSSCWTLAGWFNREPCARSSIGRQARPSPVWPGWRPSCRDRWGRDRRVREWYVGLPWKVLLTRQAAEEPGARDDMAPVALLKVAPVHLIPRGPWRLGAGRREPRAGLLNQRTPFARGKTTCPAGRGAGMLAPDVGGHGCGGVGRQGR